MVTFFFVRHGESTDNTRALWAGWRDAPLTNYGMNQARALGAAFAPLHFKALHCSDLKRAIMTTEAIREAQTDLKPPIYQSALLREQNFGSGEGKRWNSSRTPGLSLEKHYEKGVYPALRGRSERFPGGESLVDLASRAERAIDDILLSYVSEEHDEANIAVVSHGLFLSELIAALVKRDDTVRTTGREVYARDFQGMKNTGWTKVTVTAKEVTPGQGEADMKKPACLRVKVAKVNNHDHLLLVKRQRGGIGSSAYDPQQKGIRSFLTRGIRQDQKCENLVDEVVAP